MTHNTGHAWTITYNGGIAEDELIGTVLADGSWGQAGKLKDQVIYGQYTSIANGTLGDIRYFSSNNKSGKLKVGLYSSVNDSPSALLVSSLDTSVVPGWNTIQLPSLQSIVLGTKYFIAAISDTTDLISLGASAPTTLTFYENGSYNSGLPATATPVSAVARDHPAKGYGLKVV